MDGEQGAAVLRTQHAVGAVELNVGERVRLLMERESVVKTCAKCHLHEGRTHSVYGGGPVDVQMMIVGEAPGADEDAQGIAFVGKAGNLLDRMIAAMGMKREQVYLCNIIKCRPPRNRSPRDDEIACCLPYLKEQIDLVKPTVILAMGSTAIRGLLGRTGITQLRGRWMLYNASHAAIPVMPTFHPAYLLREPRAKRPVWGDLQAVLKQLNLPLP